MMHFLIITNAVVRCLELFKIDVCNCSVIPALEPRCCAVKWELCIILNEWNADQMDTHSCAETASYINCVLGH